MADLSDVRLEPHDVAPGEASLDAGAPASRAVAVWRALIVGVLLLFVVLLGWRLVDTNQAEQRASGMAPPFTFTTFEGETISLDDLRGQGVVLNFWASWCDPCRDEAVLLEQSWQRERENGIVFIGLDYLDQEPAAKAYLAEFGVTYPSGPDLRSEAARRYGIKGVPETFFINPAGEITQLVIGPIVNEASRRTPLHSGHHSSRATALTSLALTLLVSTLLASALVGVASSAGCGVACAHAAPAPTHSTDATSKRMAMIWRFFFILMVVNSTRNLIRTRKRGLRGKVRSTESSTPQARACSPKARRRKCFMIIAYAPRLQR